MAIVYCIREGSGDYAIANRQIVDLAKIIARFQTLRTKYSMSMPVIGCGVSNAVAGPRAVVVQTTESDALASPFMKIGYFLLENIAPKNVHNWD